MILTSYVRGKLLGCCVRFISIERRPRTTFSGSRLHRKARHARLDIVSGKGRHDDVCLFVCEGGVACLGCRKDQGGIGWTEEVPVSMKGQSSPVSYELRFLERVCRYCMHRKSAIIPTYIGYTYHRVHGGSYTSGTVPCGVAIFFFPFFPTSSLGLYSSTNFLLRVRLQYSTPQYSDRMPCHT
jgi:hypothetical protein